LLKISESDTDAAAEVTLGDDADAADGVDYTYPIPNEESGRVAAARLTLVRMSNSSSVRQYGTPLG